MEETKTKPTYLIKGDLSGIQEFIFSIPSKGGAKTLKVRSFFIQAITQLCIRKIMDDYDLTPEQRISDRGGSFYLGMEGKMKDIKDVQAKLNEELFGLGLFLTLSQTLFDTWGSANSRLVKEEENQKFKKYMHSRKLFQPFDRKSPIGIQRWKNFANKLAATGAKYGIEQEQGGSDILTDNSIFLFGYRLTLSKDGQVSPTSFNKVPVWRKGNKYFDNKDQYPIKTWESEYLAKNDADADDKIIKGSPIDLNHLGLEARYRTGTDKIAVIALDVDNLGDFFKQKKDIEEMKIAEQALKNFFIDELGNLWQNEKFNGNYYCDNILILFSGGDDCFILGAWDASFHFLNLLHAKFKRFAEREKLLINKHPLSFSASILLVDASFPMIRLGDMAKDMLAVAKRGNKNSVCLFEQQFTWQEFHNIISMSETLRDLIVNKDLKFPTPKFSL